MSKPHVETEAQIVFPANAMVGTLGDFARAMAEGTEVPEEFYFVAGLTFLGATCGSRLKLEAAIDVEPRFYTVLLGESADVKKSTALRKTADFFRLIWEARMDTPTLCYGVGSAEGLARTLEQGRYGVILTCDELKAFIEKTKIESSTLLPMVASLFEQTNYENATKQRTVKVEGAHLSLVGCCTTDTYSSMWTPEAIAIGFPNRLLVVTADRKRRVSWPEPRDPAKLDEIRGRLLRQLGRLPLSPSIEADAKVAWQEWYEHLPSSVHAKRLDSIGFRLMAVMALTTDKSAIDLETIRRVIAILNYELAVRALTDPIDADRTIARIEETIRRQLRTRGLLSERELRRYTNADRHGLWVFKAALKNLVDAHDVSIDSATSKYKMWGTKASADCAAEASSESSSVPVTTGNFNAL
jgi:hypothetical protein